MQGLLDVDLCGKCCDQKDAHFASFNVSKNPTRCKSMQIFIHCKVTLYVSGVTAPETYRVTLQ